MPKVLIVGGAGYVGSMLVQALVQRECSVRVLDRFFYGTTTASLPANVEVVQADMRQVPHESLADVEVVINLGGLSNDPTANYNPVANWEMNYYAVVQLAEQCKSVGVPRYIFASSCAVYDRKINHEHAKGPLWTEDCVLEPVGHYSKAKFAAERDLLSLNDSNFSVVIFRKGTVFGYSPRLRFDLVVNTMVRDVLMTGSITLHGGGDIWRPIISVRDVARAYLHVLEHPPAISHGQIFNLVDSNVRIADLGKRVQNVLCDQGIPCRIHLDYQQPRSRNYRASSTKAREALGFTTQVSVEDAVEELLTCVGQLSRDELNHPRYFNIRWMQVLEEAASILQTNQNVFDVIPGAKA